MPHVYDGQGYEELARLRIVGSEADVWYTKKHPPGQHEPQLLKGKITALNATGSKSWKYGTATPATVTVRVDTGKGEVIKKFTLVDTDPYERGDEMDGMVAEAFTLVTGPLLMLIQLQNARRDFLKDKEAVAEATKLTADDVITLEPQIVTFDDPPAHPPTINAMILFKEPFYWFQGLHFQLFAFKQIPNDGIFNVRPFCLRKRGNRVPIEHALNHALVLPPVVAFMEELKRKWQEAAPEEAVLQELTNLLHYHNTRYDLGLTDE